MRRIRHVTLPVRSWQYVGLLIVSLFCLTLGLVSRDREGRHGTLAGPELQHIAPHKVDACPNISPYSIIPILDSTSIDTEMKHKVEMVETNPSRKLQENSRKNGIRRFLNNRSTARAFTSKLASFENRRQTSTRLTKESRNLQERSSERFQVRIQNREARERRLQNQFGKTINSTPSQNQETRTTRDPRRDIERSYKLRPTSNKRVTRIQELSPSPSNSRQRARSLDRASFSARRVNSRFERQEILIRRVSPQVKVSRYELVNRNKEIRQIRTSETSKEDFRINSLNLMPRNRNIQLESSRSREFNRNFRLENIRAGNPSRNIRLETSRQIENNYLARDALLQMQKRNAKHTLTSKIDLSQRMRINSNFRSTSANPKLESRSSEQNNLRDNRLEIRKNRFNEVPTSNLNRINHLHQREIRTSIKPGMAWKYLNFEFSNVSNYEVLRQALIIALCIIYGTSIYNDKNSIVKRFASQINRLVAA